MSVYQTYIDAMNDKIRKQSAVSNPFKFKHIASLKVNKSYHFFLTKKLSFLQFMFRLLMISMILVLVLYWLVQA